MPDHLFIISYHSLVYWLFGDCFQALYNWLFSFFLKIYIYIFLINIRYIANKCVPDTVIPCMDLFDLQGLGFLVKKKRTNYLNISRDTDSITFIHSCYHFYER